MKRISLFFFEELSKEEKEKAKSIHFHVSDLFFIYNDNVYNYFDAKQTIDNKFEIENIKFVDNEDDTITILED